MYRFLYTIVFIVFRTYWFLFRPHTYGGKVLIEDAETGSYLFVRHGYGSQKWSLPGGGKKHDEENTVATVIREAQEETSLELRDVRLVGSYETTEEYKHDHVDCYHALAIDPSTLKIDGREIIEAKWFPRTALPIEVTQVAMRTLVYLNSRRKDMSHWV